MTGLWEDLRSYYLTFKGGKGEELFTKEADYRYYLYLLKKFKARFRVNLFAFCLLPQQVDMVVQPFDPENINIFMQCVAEHYQDYFDEDESGESCLRCCRYRRRELEGGQALFAAVKLVEALPVSAGLADAPAKYPYSSLGLRISDNHTGLLDKTPFLYKEEAAGL